VTRPSYQIDEGYFVELKTLAKHLTEMSHDAHQWGAIPIPGTYRRGNGSPESYALIAYSNPEPPGLLNALCFIAPMVALGDGGADEPELIVCWSSHTIEPLTNALYIEDGEIKYDLLEDFERVWSPIRKRLWPEYWDQFDTTTNNFNEPRDIPDQRSEDAYRREFVAYLDRMAGSKDLVEAAVSGSIRLWNGNV
jgi:hypothetical protein